jgi:pyruvate/2-oxoglutarate dehydrogenase complex dihydrolipoamide dehydrogenase (E3) component
VRVIGAEARFADARTLLAGEDRITARAFIIATGARSVSPSLPGLENTPYFTAETIFDNTRRLTHLLVVGAGANGLELAQAYNRLGTEVTVVASDGGHPFAGLDPDLGDVVVQQMREEGVSIRPDSSVVELQARSQGIGVIVRTGGSDERLDVSHILVDAGRIPDVDPLDLERAGVRRDATDGRALALSANLRTSNRRIYAIGGAAGVPERASLDAAQAAAVVRHALLLAPFRIHAAEAPVCYFTDPEVATIGLSETAARASKGEAFEVLRASFADNARAHATRRTYGLVKLIVGRDGGLLGAGIVGDRAGELITTLALAMSQRLKVGQLDRLLVPHPTLSETFVALARDYSRSGGVGLVERRLLSLRRYLP